MKPVLVLIGRSNVGKSSLFNRLTRSRNALVADFPGLTRDRNYGDGKFGTKHFLIVDTGGFEPKVKENLSSKMEDQTIQAVIEGDVIIFLVDAKEGLTQTDFSINEFLRKRSKKVILAVNKAEGMNHDSVRSDFFELGCGIPYLISAAHGDGVKDLLDKALESASKLGDQVEKDTFNNKNIRIAVVGKPNVGKSTLVNSLLGEERVVSFDMPGTTRDSIEVSFEINKKKYTLIDTAGIRRRRKVFEIIEKFSIIKTMQSITGANVVLLLLDAKEKISDQDANIASFIFDSGKSLVVGVNKWDSINSEQRLEIKSNIDRKLSFLNFVDFHFISALKSNGFKKMFNSIDNAYICATRKLSTPKLTRVLHDAVEHQPPRRKGSIRPKLRYAHQGGQNPPIIVIHGNSLNFIDLSYKKYLEKRFRETFSLIGTPLKIVFRKTKNPFDKKE